MALDGRIGLLALGLPSLLWIAIASLFLAAAVAVSTCRRMLGYFSRKRLLEDVDEAERRRLEALLSRVDAYGAALRAVDQCLRLALVASLAFAFLSSGRAAAGIHWELVGFLAFTGGLLLVLIFFLELAPSVLCRLRPEWAVRVLLPALDRLHRVLDPLIRAYLSLVRAGARAMGGKEERTSAAVVEEEILSAVEEGQREGLLRQGDITMIESIIRFRDREVSEVMTPRTEMVCLHIKETMEEAVRVAIECGHSRIPVYKKNKDKIVGILYVKDLLRFWSNREAASMEIRDIIRQSHFVPESKKISELFHEFKSQRFHIAIIVDEFGGTAGLITIEDIIEEIMGEIVDEFEKEERPEYQRLAADLVEVDARLPLRDLNDRLEVNLPEGDAYDTIGGFVFSAMGKVPRVGDSCDFGSLHFEVIEADERKVNRLRIRVGSEVKPPAAARGKRGARPARRAGDAGQPREPRGGEKPPPSPAVRGGRAGSPSRAAPGEPGVGPTGEAPGD